LNPPREFHVSYGLQLSMTLAMTGRISRIESPSHPVSVQMDGHEATVTLSSREAALDRDFVLSVEAEGLDAPLAWFEHDDDGAGAIAVAFVPKLASGSTPSDITFVVDRSGSMEGTSIEEVRNALQLCLRSMIPGCRFNIVGFGTTYQALFQESRSYDEASLADASKHVAALAADLGGTEILSALNFVLEQKPDPTLPRQIVVLTDGEVTNTDAVMALAKSHAARARIFTFGIGAGASQHLVNGLARAGGGTAEFIFPGERIEPKVMRQFGRLLSPAMTNVRIDWGGHDVTPAMTSLPPVFAGGRLLAFALAKGATESVRLTADSPAGPLSLEARISPSHRTRGRTVATLAARARIRELEESPEWLTSRGSRQTERRASGVRQEIIALAIKYGLMSRETSFVAIERRETPVLGDVQLRRVPIAVTTGWGGADIQWLGLSYRTSDSRTLLAAPMASADLDAMLMRSHAPRASKTIGSLFGLLRSTRDTQADAVPQPKQAAEPMHALVALQHADGSWDLTKALAAVIGRTLSDLESALGGATGKPDEIRRAWATSLAVVWLRTEAAQAEPEWSLLAAKATRWVDRVQAQAPGGDWIDAAERFLRKVTST
jgi:Ca-activated chloride channel family protein